ncbi:6-phospho-alpha-glucosidase [Anaerococcus lactolyticus]|uniref:Family 4 glycosyl hydrolase n=2 Tax=Anaerococcus lactolyticus TaxID=33032 RepID=C2BFE3_9FIRM|nr:6-phospho-alpha-glucosidase [Anaerococcus lactolyticus]EEI86347.1 family 4 glycosyl hydrolase [Anaerococcus lactolyticus ATCC 51172]KGF05557.1 6-phospho-alpha-glucosidase [Anaerococcus lactolyticus S7-1-13]
MEPKIITIVGGGSTYTPGVVKAILSKKDTFHVKEIRAYDIDYQRQEDVSIIVRKVIENDCPECKFITTTDPETAFKDSDFIFAQIRVGKYKMREMDEKISLKYGAVGQETCGCGGLTYGLRTIYPMVEILDYVAKYANPNHWILNYSNPAAIVALALKKIRPNARIINICDMPVAIVNSFADILNCNPKDIKPFYFGLNHFGWFTDVWVNGESRFKELLDHAMKSGYLCETPDEQHWEPSWVETYKNVKPMINRFPDYLPNTYLEYYLLSQDIVDHSNKNYTRANEVIDGREKTLFDAINQYKETGKYDDKTFVVGAHATFIVDLAESLCKENGGRYLLIVENNGAVANLPDDAMVEIPCYVSPKGIEKTSVGHIPTFYKGLIEQQYASEKCIVEGAIEHSYTKVLQGFALNKTIKSSTQAKEILDEMIEANKEYWPELR